jgi:hypothetical protein
MIERRQIDAEKILFALGLLATAFLLRRRSGRDHGERLAPQAFTDQRDSSSSASGSGSSQPPLSVSCASDQV